MQVLATCCTNTFSKYLEPMPGLEGAQGTTVRVSYLLAAMMSHSCIPNTEQAIHSLADGLKFELRATRPIARGEQITITYTELLAPTAVRQFELLNSKLFLCSCRRCTDPSELGSGASAVRCSSCLKSRKAGQAKLGSQPKAGREELGRGLALLMEALDILRDEAPDSFGGQLYLGGLASLPEVEQFVSSH